MLLLAGMLRTLEKTEALLYGDEKTPSDREHFVGRVRHQESQP